jgi:pyruvate kinase
MDITYVAKELDLLYRDLINAQFKNRQIAESLPEEYRRSGVNLLHYLTMRSRDLRKVHDFLSDIGMSGLRNSEGYVLRNITDVLRLLYREIDQPWQPYADIAAITYKQGKKLLKQHNHSLLGKGQATVKTNVMIEARRKRLSELPEVIKELKPAIVHFDLMLCGYDRSLAAIQHIKTSISKSKRPTIICSMQGRRVVLDTRLLYNEQGNKQKRRLRLQVGDHLIIDNTARYGSAPAYGEQGQLLSPAIAPTLLRDTPLLVSPGDLVLLDGDKIETRVIEATDQSMTVIVTKCQLATAVTLSRYAEVWLPQNRGPLLSPADVRNIGAVLVEADALCIGGLDKPDRINDLAGQLGSYSDQLRKLIMRIDHPDVVRQLPLTMLKAMRKYQIGIWLDGNRLYSEIGPARLPELQDQIAWIAEAAHVPMLYGMPLLTTMSGQRRPSRSELIEVIDATRAEVVSLSHTKWLHLKYAVLIDILSRTEKHYSKRKAQMRALTIAQENIAGLDALL